MIPTYTNETFLCFFFSLLPSLISEYRHLERLYIKVVSAKARVFFLRRCLEEKVVPNSMRWIWKTNQDQPFPNQASTQIKMAIVRLKDEIDHLYFKLRRARRELSSKIDNFQLWSRLQSILRQVSERQKLKKVKNLKGKLERLIEKSPWSIYSRTENVVNCSSFKLKKHHIELLGYGMNFSFPHQKHSLFNFIECLEKNKSSIDSTQYNCIFMNLDQIFHNLKNDFSDFFPKRYSIALNDLKKEKSIKICKADKGAKIVVMDTCDYNSKVVDLLTDNKVYKKIRKNPLSRMQSEFNRGLKLIGQKYDSPNLKKVFSCKLPSLPYIYGLPKIHKPETPLRPIVSNVNCPAYKLSKWLTKELSPLLGSFSKSHLKHNVDLLERLKNIVPGQKKFISFDVSSLYTNVPLKPTLDFLKRKMSCVNVNLNKPVDYYIELIELCLKNSCFQFEDIFYEQVSGLAMGCPLSSFLANIFLEHVESELLPNYNGVKPLFWWRYVDDVLGLVPANFVLNDFLIFINSLYPTLKFTHEWEIDGKIPFLDVLIHNLSTHLEFSVYRKPTNSESYLHFFSYNEPHIKVALAQSLFLRAYRVCSPTFLNSEIDHIFNSLKKLAYPEHILKKSLNKAKKSFFNPPKRDKDTQISTKNMIVVPYVPVLEKLKYPLKKLDQNLVFKYNNKISHNLIKNKPQVQTKAGVYKIPCKDCNKFYVGETGRTLEKRIVEHKNDIKNQTPESGVADHVKKN